MESDIAQQVSPQAYDINNAVSYWKEEGEEVNLCPRLYTNPHTWQ